MLGTVHHENSTQETYPARQYELLLCLRIAAVAAAAVLLLRSSFAIVHFRRRAESGLMLMQSKRFEVDLRAGEALYLPSGWMHDIESSGIYQSITYWMYQDAGHHDMLQEQ